MFLCGTDPNPLLSKGLMTHMADPESCSVSLRLPDNQGGLAYYKCRRVNYL